MASIHNSSSLRALYTEGQDPAITQRNPNHHVTPYEQELCDSGKEKLEGRETG